MAEASSHQSARSPFKCWHCWKNITPRHSPLCRNGHTICPPCAYGFDWCRLCNQCYLPYSCQYQAQGCPKFIKSTDISSHATACSYRPIKCRVLKTYACEWRGIYMHLHRHISNKHGDTIQAMSGNFKVSWKEWMPKKAVMTVRVFGKRFYLFRETSSSDITWAFQFTGQYSDNRKYRYRMVVFSDNPQIHPITYHTMEVHDIRDCLEEMDDGYCVYAKAVINRFKAANGAVQFEIVVIDI